MSRPNHPAAGKAGIALCFDFGHHCPGLPEPGRSAMQRLAPCLGHFGGLFCDRSRRSVIAL